jgi:hypothetical protein
MNDKELKNNAVVITATVLTSYISMQVLQNTSPDKISPFQVALIFVMAMTWLVMVALGVESIGRFFRGSKTSTRKP